MGPRFWTSEVFRATANCVALVGVGDSEGGWGLAEGERAQEGARRGVLGLRGAQRPEHRLLWGWSCKCNMA